MKDIRWIQRFNNFKKAYSQMEDGILLAKERKLSNLEKQGLIQAFEYTHELAWKTIKDFLEKRGVSELFGSRDATREAFKLGLIDNGELWMEMILSRNITSHTYDEATADKILKLIIEQYNDAFNQFKQKMSTYENKEMSNS